MTASATVRTVSQSVKLSLPHTSVEGAPLSAKVTLSPARAGRAVQVEVKSGKSWLVVATGLADVTGKASFTVTPGLAGATLYRAVAATWNGAPSTKSKTATVKVGRAFKLDAGSSDTCIRTRSGIAECWGYNDSAQLGDGTTNLRTKPLKVKKLGSNIKAVAAGYGHTCAITASGGVKCWGMNDSGELGNGTLKDQRRPVSVVGLSKGVVQVTASSGGHTCALLKDGTVKCWGSNWAGQLGDGSHIDKLTPVKVTGLPGAVRAIDAASSMTCALITDGTMYCWGDNRYGQLGDGTTDVRWTPVQVTNLTGVAGIAAGGSHTCALTTTGEVRCWGENWAGQLGDGTTTNSLVPVAVAWIVGQRPSTGQRLRPHLRRPRHRRGRVLGRQRGRPARRRHRQPSHRSGRGARRDRCGAFPDRRPRPHLRGVRQRRVVLGPQRGGSGRRRHHRHPPVAGSRIKLA